MIGKLQVGDRVCYPGAFYYGKVTSVGEKQVLVAWEDGHEDTWTFFDEVKPVYRTRGNVIRR